MERSRRLPSAERAIKDISESDFRVRVLGTIVDVDEANLSAMLDDGTARAVLVFADPEQLALAKDGSLVRVIGKTKRRENLEIEVETIQDMSKLDLQLYNQAKYAVENLTR